MATIEKRIYDGNRAKEVLENEVFQQVFADIEQELFDAWTNSPQRDSEGREKIHQCLTMLKKLKANITTTLETGRLAQLELHHRQTVAERAKAWLHAVND